MTTTVTTSASTETSTSTATMTTTMTTVGWQLIAKQDISQALFDDSARETFLQNTDDPSAFAYMVIGNLDAMDASLHFNGFYRFKLFYGPAVMLEWEQSSWLTEPVITGFRCIAPADCGPSTLSPGLRFKGLGRSQSGWSVLDGNGAEQWPFNSVGTLRMLGGGIPGWNFTAYQTMELQIAHHGPAAAALVAPTEPAPAPTQSVPSGSHRRLRGLAGRSSSA